MREREPAGSIEADARLSAPLVVGQVGAALVGLRAALGERHGWTHLEVSARAHLASRTVVLHGEVAVDRLVARVAEVAQAAAPGWSIDHAQVRPMTGGAWHELPHAVVLLAARPGFDPQRRVATELRPHDGPVQRLSAPSSATLGARTRGEDDGATVVRGRDGTVGWLQTPLGPEVAPPRLPPPHGDDPHALAQAVRRWVGVPYRLGGVTPEGVDCSALVQRTVLDVLGVLLPRHSSDQLQVAPREGVGLGAGDLSFVWSDREALCHVGIGTGETVVHASLSRRRVVEDSRPAFVVGARRVMHVPFAELLALGRRVAGQPSLTAAGFRLGRDATD